MEYEIRFLRNLEQDLERAAVRARRAGRVARRWIPAVAAVLVVAWGIGYVVENPISFGGREAMVALDEGGASGGDAREVSAALEPSRDKGFDASYSPFDPESEEALGVDLEQAAGGLGQPTQARTDGSRAPGDLSKIVRTGRMRVKVDDGTFRDARDAAVTIAEDAGGFVLDSRVEGRSGTFTLRVPARRFDNVMTQLGRLGDVELEEQNGEDVTAEFIDLSARVRILTARRDVIQDLMEQATTLGQTLLLQNRFDEVQLQLERVTGELRFLRDQVSESTITLEIVERTAPQAQEQPENPSLLEAWQRGIQGFLNVVAVAIIGLGYLLPLLVAVGVWFGIREVMRRRRRG
jgi:hypothetical protein